MLTTPSVCSKGLDRLQLASGSGNRRDDDDDDDDSQDDEVGQPI